MPADLIARLETITIFRSLPDSDRRALLERARLLHLPRGGRLVRQGDEADTIYYVLRGRFEVLRNGVVVAEIGAGEPVGEIAFFAGLRRTADVFATRDSDVLELTRAEWNDLARQIPAMNDEVLKSLGQRLAAATASAPVLPPKVPGAIGLCAAGASALPAGLAQALERALGDCGAPVTALRAADLPSGLDPAQPSALSGWLAGFESRGRLLLLVTGDGDDAWDQAALRHCDHLLLCGRLSEAGAEGQDRPVPLSAAEALALPLFRPRQRSLILWRTAAREPLRGSRHWLEGRDPHLHHHLALDSAADVARLARFLTGRACGAVFGGGGAFGAAHIGALRALLGAGLRFDLAGGTSIGSTVAVALAQGADPQQMLEDFQRTLAREKAIGRLTLPRYALFDSHRADAVLHRQYGDLRLEDLPLTTFAAAANLTSHELELQRRGPVWAAVRASTAIPGALPPMVTAEGEVLVDGGIMENVPVAAMRALKAGPNAILSLSSGAEWRIAARYSDLPTRAKMLWQTLTRRPDPTDLPRFGEVIGRAMQVTSQRVLRGAGPGGDLFLELPCHRSMGLLSFGMAREQEALGYDYTARLISELGGPEALLAWARDWQR